VPVHDPGMIEVPRELLWDYAEAPLDELWRLQRIADFFPRYGRDRATVEALHARRDALRIPPEIGELIGIYHRLWGERHHGHAA
jgi:hypothetical protein